jgi:hypothetical protein
MQCQRWPLLAILLPAADVLAGVPVVYVIQANSRKVPPQPRMENLTVNHCRRLPVQNWLSWSWRLSFCCCCGCAFKTSFAILGRVQ